MSPVKPSRNAPCPCGSGIKYKKCCLPKEVAAKPPALPPGSRIVHRDGQSFVVSKGVSDEMIGDAALHFERRDRGRGPAAMMVEFTQPLIDAAGDDRKSIERAMTLGMLFWNLALCRDRDAYDELLNPVLATVAGNDEERAQFLVLAEQMVERHRQMFPGLHKSV